MLITEKRLNRRTLLQTGAGVAGAGLFAAHLTSPMTADAQDADATPQPGGTLTLSVSQITSNSHLLHLRHYAGSENIYIRLLMEARLVTLANDRTTFVGDAAETFEFAEDGSTLTFHLRPGMTWHDGTPFTAKDVDFTYHIVSTPGVAAALFGTIFLSTIVGMKEYIDGGAERISGISTPDDATVVFELFPNLNQFGVLSLFNQICLAPDHVLNMYLDRAITADILQSEWATTAAHIGLGPFRVVEYVADQYVRYEPFENYYKGKPLLGEVIYRSFADATTNVAALQNREVDAGRIPATEFERMQEFDFLNFYPQKSPSYQGSPFNSRQPYLNKDVRQGLLHAIDRQAIADVIYAGAVEVVHSQIWVPQFGDSPNLKTYEYDPEKAKALLASGGWDGSRKLRWAVGVVPSDELVLAYYAAINGYWESVGVQAEFQVFGTDATVLWGPNWDFDLYPSAYPISIPESVALHYDPRRATYVSSGYDTPEFVAMWDAVYQQHPDEEQQQLVWNLQNTMAEEALGLTVVRSVDIWGVDKRVHGLIPNYFPYEDNLFDWQLEKVWVEQ